MHVRQFTRKPLTIAVAAIIATGAFAATAAAVLTASSGTTQTQMSNASSTDVSTTNSTTWQPLAGSDVPLTLSASGLINARFTAESSCTGFATGVGFCSVRIVAINSAGTVTELSPASSRDFVFDTDAAGTANDQYESNAMERSLRLPAGDYRFRIEIAVTAPTTNPNPSPVTARLDDWHFAVEASA
jgi:hypothetical protein